MTPTVKAAWIGAIALVGAGLIPLFSGTPTDMAAGPPEQEPREPFSADFEAPQTVKGVKRVPMGKWDFCTHRETIVNKNGSFDCDIDKKGDEYFLITAVHGTSAEVVCRATCTSR